MTAVSIPGTDAKRRTANGDALLGLVMVAPIFVVMLALVFFPLVATVWDSLHRINPMQAGTPFIGLANYINMFSDAELGRAWSNTFIYVAIAVAAETVFGVLAASRWSRPRLTSTRWRSAWPSSCNARSAR